MSTQEPASSHASTWKDGLLGMLYILQTIFTWPLTGLWKVIKNYEDVSKIRAPVVVLSIVGVALYTAAATSIYFGNYWWIPAVIVFIIMTALRAFTQVFQAA
jgi:hypothetical protein